jgi:acid phosphatase type 7
VAKKLAQVVAHWQTAALLAALALWATNCGGHSDSTTSPTPTPPVVPVNPGEPVLVGAGDIAMCPGGAQEATAQLLDRVGGTVFTAGDNVYYGPTAEHYTQCYGLTWGRHLSRTRPTPGNHDYESPGPSTYFAYFGAAAGDPGLGYYSYDIASWHVVALNTELSVKPGSSQYAWLQSDLASYPARCTVAYFHYPLFSSSQGGPIAAMRDVWRLLYANGVDVVINGNDHVYERFAPQDPDGKYDGARGIVEFIVGTGGATLYGFGTPLANSESRASVYGVLKLSLQSGTYAWEFMPATPGAFSDSGVGTCH